MRQDKRRNAPRSLPKDKPAYASTGVVVARNVTWLVLAMIHSCPGIPGKDATTPTKETQNTIGNLFAYGK